MPRPLSMTVPRAPRTYLEPCPIPARLPPASAFLETSRASSIAAILTPSTVMAGRAPALPRLVASSKHMYILSISPMTIAKGQLEF